MLQLASEVKLYKADAKAEDPSRYPPVCLVFGGGRTANGGEDDEVAAVVPAAVQEVRDAAGGAKNRGPAGDGVGVGGQSCCRG